MLQTSAITIMKFSITVSHTKGGKTRNPVEILESRESNGHVT